MYDDRPALLNRSWGASWRRGAFVGRGDMPFMAMRPAGVGTGSTHGIPRTTSMIRKVLRSLTAAVRAILLEACEA